AVHPDGAAKTFHDGAHDMQAQAQASVMARGDPPFEGLEDLFLDLRRDADPLVRHLERGAPVASADGNLNGLPEAELDRVRQEVGYDLIEEELVPLPNRLSIGRNRQRGAGLGDLRTQPGCHLAHHRAEVYFFEGEMEATGSDPA